MAKSSRVSVTYREISGWHVFTSEDVRGLYVAGPDRYKAYNDVAFSLEALALKNDGVERKYSPEASAKEFFDSLSGIPDDSSTGGPKVILHAAA